MESREDTLVENMAKRDEKGSDDSFSEMNNRIQEWYQKERAKYHEQKEEKKRRLIGDLLSIAKDWRVWLILGVCGYFLAMMWFYPFAGALLSLVGIIASATLGNFTMRMLLVVFFAYFLMWSAFNVERPQFSDGFIFDPPERSDGYGPTARP